MNFALLSALDNVAPVSVTNVTFVYVNYERQPGNDVGLVNKVFRSLRAMCEDMEFPLHEIGRVVSILHDIFGLPDLVSRYEDFSKSSYTQNTEAYKLAQRRALVEELVAQEAEFKDTIQEIVAEEQRATGWREAFDLLVQEPTRSFMRMLPDVQRFIKTNLH